MLCCACRSCTPRVLAPLRDSGGWTAWLHGRSKLLSSKCSSPRPSLALQQIHFEMTRYIVPKDGIWMAIFSVAVLNCKGTPDVLILILNAESGLLSFSRSAGNASASKNRQSSRKTRRHELDASNARCRERRTCRQTSASAQTS